MGKFVLLNLGQGSVETGFDDITVQVWSDQSSGLFSQYGSSLPANPELADCYQRWQKIYRYSWPQDPARITILNEDISHFSITEFQDLCQQLEHLINTWFSNEDFIQKVDQPLRQFLSRDDEVQVILESRDQDLVRRLPLHQWHFFQDFPKAELVISEKEWRTVNLSQTPPGVVRILAVFGDKTGLQLGDERDYLSQLDGAEVYFLDEPRREDLLQCLTNEYWDILFFAGHSHTQEQTGWIQLNSSQSLSIQELRQELNVAIENGLQLAIFNSCDGLGIAQQLGKLNIPHVIVMREQVLDHLAQIFLKHLLEYLSTGLCLYLAVKQARQALSRQQKFLCASWLPVLLQNPTAPSPTWKSLRFYRLSDGICPYKGLEFFDCNDEDPKYFFGRESLVNRLLEHVRHSSFLALVGASGNGKSSVLRAGLLYQLKLGIKIQGSDQWEIKIIRPEQQPIHNLAMEFVNKTLSKNEWTKELEEIEQSLSDKNRGLQGLVQKSDAPRLILVVDQFEEIFTRCTHKEREQFLFTLMLALSGRDNKLCIIIAMRSDFLGKCMEQEYSGFTNQVEKKMIAVLPMEAEEIKSAILQPAEQVGLQLETGLVTAMINDIQGSPGTLPLLQYTLKRLWHERQGSQLLLSAYQALGGIQGALDKRATDIYQGFEKSEQLAVRHIFQQLTQLGEGTEDTRRRVFQNDLVSEPRHSAQQVQNVISQLASPENRLLVTSASEETESSVASKAIVDVAHEALIRHWKLLRIWIEDNRDLLRKQRKIEASAIAWREQGKRKGDLLQGLSLDEAIQFRKKELDSFPLSDGAKFFIIRSRRHRFLSYLKLSSLLLIPALIAVGVFENDLRHRRIDSAYNRILKDKNTKEERRAVLYLLEGCREKIDFPVLHYFLILVFGNCETLESQKLEEADLRFADLNNANLRDVDLRFADLNSAYLRNADLRSADLLSTNLRFADLRDANLRDADLRDANLRDASLSDAYLRNTDFSSANLRNANLRSADLNSADLNSADLRGANLRSADLRNADLSFADLRDAEVGSVTLRRTYFLSSNLYSTTPRRTDLRDSILLATDLRTVKGLTEKQLQANSTLICNSPLPKNLSLDININRDCDEIANRLLERFPLEFPFPQAAQQYVEEAKEKTWE